MKMLKVLLTAAVAASTIGLEATAENVKERIELLKDGDLSRHWYTWLKGEGRDSDPKKVFTAEGSTLKVSGEGMGCVTTRKTYRDYKLSLEFRYVDNEVQLNKTAARDGGILFHSTGEDGAFGPGIWMSSSEFYFNGMKTGEYWDLNPSSGRIQLQSEGFGIEYRNIVLEPLE